MALRSLLRKTPALGARSWPTAPLMGAAQKLSPAAGYRLLSTDLPSAAKGGIVHPQETLSAQEEINLLRAEFDQNMKQIHRNIDACAEAFRREAEDFEGFRKEHERIRRACYAFLLLCVPATLLLSQVA